MNRRRRRQIAGISRLGAPLLGSILVNATSRQLGVFQIKILTELVRIKGREYVGQLAK